jgi:hypothetical protein
MTHVQAATMGSVPIKGRPPKSRQANNCVSPSNEPLFASVPVTQRFAEHLGSKPTPSQLARVLASGALQLASLRAERRQTSDLEPRFQLTEAIEGVLTDICELLENQQVRKSAMTWLVKDRAHPARKEIIEQSIDSDKGYRIRRFADELRTEQRTLVGLYGAKRSRMLTDQSRLQAGDEDLSPDQKMELAVATWRLAVIKERREERFQAEKLKAEANEISRRFHGQRAGWYEEAANKTFGIDVSKV